MPTHTHVRQGMMTARAHARVFMADILLFTEASCAVLSRGTTGNGARARLWSIVTMFIIRVTWSLFGSTGTTFPFLLGGTVAKTLLHEAQRVVPWHMRTGLTVVVIEPVYLALRWDDLWLTISYYHHNVAVYGQNKHAHANLRRIWV